MPRRTAEANKAIRLAWEREQELVREGKETRDWTEEQQKDILDPDKGKAYDDNGRAFELCGDSLSTNMLHVKADSNNSFTDWTLDLDDSFCIRVCVKKSMETAIAVILLYHRQQILSVCYPLPSASPFDFENSRYKQKKA